MAGRATDLGIAGRDIPGVLRRGRRGEGRHRTRGSDEGEWTDDGGDSVKTVSVRDLQKKVKECVG